MCVDGMAAVAGTPPGCMVYLDRISGGIASLDHRLQAEKPPALKKRPRRRYFITSPMIRMRSAKILMTAARLPRSFGTVWFLLRLFAVGLA